MSWQKYWTNHQIQIYFHYVMPLNLTEAYLYKLCIISGNRHFFTVSKMADLACDGNDRKILFIQKLVFLTKAGKMEAWTDK